MDRKFSARGTKSEDAVVPLHRTNEEGHQFLLHDSVEVDNTTTPLRKCLIETQYAYEKEKKEWEEILEIITHLKIQSAFITDDLPSAIFQKLDPSPMVDAISKAATKTGLTDSRIDNVKRLHQLYQRQMQQEIPEVRWMFRAGMPAADQAYSDAQEWSQNGWFYGAVPIALGTLFLKFSHGVPFWGTFLVLLAAAALWPFGYYYYYTQELSAYQKRVDELQERRAGTVRELLDEILNISIDIRSYVHEQISQLALRRDERRRGCADEYAKDLVALRNIFEQQVTHWPFALGNWSADEWSRWLPAERASRIVEGRSFLRLGRISASSDNASWKRVFDKFFEHQEIPDVTRFPGVVPLLMRCEGSEIRRAIEAAQAFVARVIATYPAGTVRLSFIDPVGLGQNAGPFLPLSDYSEELVGGKAWSEPERIDACLKDHIEHVENVIQKYLRNDYESIEAYNKDAGEIAEAYRVLVVFDFPVNFTGSAARNLVTLMHNGPSCGVFPIVIADVSRALPVGIDVSDLKRLVPVHEVSDGRVRLCQGLWPDEESKGHIVSGEEEALDVRLGRVYLGTVKNLTDAGAVVTVPPGRDGILKNDLMAEDTRLQRLVKKSLTEGDIVRVTWVRVHGSPFLSMIHVDWCEDSEVRIEKPSFNRSDDFVFELDQPCPSGLLNRIIKGVGEAAKQAPAVEVPYAKVLGAAGLDPDKPEGWWRIDGAADAGECSSAGSVEIPLGPAGARKMQLLTLGKSTAHHVLIGGLPGSGKSNLLHVIITTLAVKYSPREVELYLIDFKKGVEFKPYANHSLPHARVVAIESEREFGLSVLQGLDDEMQRRGEAFRGMEANDLAEYRQKTDSPLPRLILIVDEFQEFFSEDDAIGRQAAGILDRLVRQGRSFGIHVILGSQSLAGSYSLARSTLDQMQIRIALPCSEADSRLILADDNPAARLLSRPGEAIYNAASGLVEGNQILQVARFSDDDRQHYLQALARKAEGSRRPIVFEGHEPAELEGCAPLAALLAAPGWPLAGKGSEVWLGEPVAIKPPTSVRFRRQGGANLLVLTREEEQGVGLLAACVLGLAAQHPPDSVRFYLVDFATADAPWADLAGDLADLLRIAPRCLGGAISPGC